LGRLDQINTELESVISGLLRVTGKTRPEVPPAPSLTFESARDYGDVGRRNGRNGVPARPE